MPLEVIKYFNRLIDNTETDVEIIKKIYDWYRYLSDMNTSDFIKLLVKTCERIA
jgi:hypothetical protein